jgi:hypothetical protein
MIRTLIVAAFVVLGSAFTADGADYVRGHFRSNGTYVPGHYRSTADSSFYNNWSTRGNVNPYTGSYGTRSYPSYRSSYRYYYGR